ncbi:hypothetical protein BUL40_02315 [Croceivirga radicis]|uniref:RDD domain-containing protein n=1 Tax=Croceivirga radicis TaxID=1929488 RepID=A0A1V6LW89_9FLAO|nr:hypothetical protein [Croceivirga radicis]OQD44409.1 hypothetical protein BUL40_02315 [Croceivirga radicis]
MKKYLEKFIVLATVYLALTTTKRLIWYFETPDWITDLRIPNIWDIEYLTFAIIRFMVPIFTVLGLINCFKNRVFELNNLFNFPIFYILLDYIISVIRWSSPLYEYPKFNFTFLFIFKTLFLISVVYFISYKQKNTTKSSLIASKKKRIINFLIDSFIIILSFVSLLPNFSEIYDDIYYLLTDLGQLSKYKWILCKLFFVYYFCFELFFRQTFGKLFTDTQVQIQQSILRSIFLRTISRFIPLYFIPLFIQKEGLHDKISNTHITVASNAYK